MTYKNLYWKRMDVFAEWLKKEFSYLFAKMLLCTMYSEFSDRQMMSLPLLVRLASIWNTFLSGEVYSSLFLYKMVSLSCVLTSLHSFRRLG